MRIFLILYALLLSNAVYSVEAKSTVILLSIDGFSFTYLEKYQPKNILAFAKSGVKAQLIPVYPSKTFPNHLSIITGHYPVNHGILHNKFYHSTLNNEYYLGAGKENSTWLTAEPFWSRVEKNGIKSAVYFWPESEVKGYSHPTYNIPYNKSTSNKARVDQLIKWLKLPADKRPHFIASYFSTVDSAGHHYGIDSPQLINAINGFDTLFGYFLQRIKKEVHQPVNIILVSDHGMLQTSNEENVLTSSIFQNVNLTKGGVKVTYTNTQVFIYFDQNKLNQKSQTTIENKLRKNLSNNKKSYRIVNNKSFPQHWHLNSISPFIPNIIIEAIPPATFHWQKSGNEMLGATHGFDPKDNIDLHGIFIAAGSNILKDRVVEPFNNIHIFPFMNTLLGLNEKLEVDGRLSVLKPIIK